MLLWKLFKWWLTESSIQVVLKDERQSQALLLKVSAEIFSHLFFLFSYTSIFNPISMTAYVCVFTDCWLLLRWAHVSAQMCPALADVLSGWATSLQGEQLVLGPIRKLKVYFILFYFICCFFCNITTGVLVFFRLSTVTVLINWRRTWWATTSRSLRSSSKQKHQHGKLMETTWW